MHKRNTPEIIMPTRQELRNHMLSTLRHACHVEYFLEQFALGNSDPERPHDIAGPGNKFDWEVMSGMAVQYRKNLNGIYQRIVEPSLALHQIQQHHARPLLQDASDEDMLIASIDTICTLLEPSQYSGAHSYDDIPRIIQARNPAHAEWVMLAWNEMRRMQQPRILHIGGLELFDNVGLPAETYDAIKGRVEKVRGDLVERGYTF